MDLGIQIEPQLGYRYDEILAIGRAGERSGFTRLWLSDHFFLNPEAVTTDCLEVWTALAALARELRTIRIGPMVSAQSYRNPALLAKTAAAVDRLSGGRLDFGVGAGWKEVEYRAYGYAFPSPARRVAELVDTLEICVRMWREERATYRGPAYSVVDALCAPKPLQSPLPIWVGGTKPRMLRVIARYATWINHGGPSVDNTLAGIEARQRAVDAACLAVRREPGTLHRSAFLSVVTAPTAAAVDALVAELAGQANQTPERWRAARPAAIVGPPDAVADRLRAYARLGIEHANLLLPYRRELEAVEALRTVVPALA